MGSKTHTFSRRRFGVFIGLSPLIPNVSFAATKQKTIDKRNASEEGEFAIGFASKLSDEGFDHAFVVWYYSDAVRNRSVQRCVGFYPVASDDTKSYDMVLGVSGKVMDDSKTKIDTELTVLVSKAIFDEATNVEKQYQNGHTYHLAFDDCTTFVKKVAEAIPGLSFPSRVSHPYPSSFISALFDEN